jgi:hypothetical protein
MSAVKTKTFLSVYKSKARNTYFQFLTQCEFTSTVLEKEKKDKEKKCMYVCHLYILLLQ